MNYHILNGDALVDRFQQANIEGEMILCRECLIEGPSDEPLLQAFWKQRARYISATFDVTEENYYEHAVAEYQKLTSMPEGSSVYLWFEDDLFCQANLWFTIFYLSSFQKRLHLFRIFPEQNTKRHRWAGFGNHLPDQLKQSYQNKVAFTTVDIQLGADLWSAYSMNDLDRLKNLSATTTTCFKDLGDVVQAHIDRFSSEGSLGRPGRRLKEIKETGLVRFEDIYTEFFSKEGIYGFGDVQVKKMLEKMG